MKKPLVVHPLLFAAFPVLALLAQNLDWIPVADVMRALAVAFALAAALLGVAWLATRDLPKAGLIASLALLLFFSYGHLYGALKEAGLGTSVARHRYFAPAAMALLLGGIVGVLRYVRDARQATRVLNMAAAILLVFPIFTIFSGQIGSPASTPRENQSLRLPPGEVPPDIYFIVVDGYARQDTLWEVYDLDNEPFLSTLEDQGFFVDRRARANYAQTSLALASALNMQYVDALVLENERGRDPLWQLIQDSEVRHQFEKLGYEIVAFESGLSGTEWRDADLYLGPSTLDVGANPYESLLAQTTALRLVTDGAVALPRLIPTLDYPYQAHRNRLQYILDNLDALSPSERPRLIFAHLILPHPPFVFDAEGNPITPDAPFSLDYPSGGSIDGYIQGYRDQVRFLNQELERVIGGILARSATTPVIIIQADHGPDSNSGLQDYVQERMTILNALLLPGDSFAERPHITPVNTFRRIFNELFGGNYARLPDRALFSQYEEPYDFIDVTGSVVPP